MEPFRGDPSRVAGDDGGGAPLRRGIVSSARGRAGSNASSARARWLSLAVFLLAATVALLSARPFAGGWYDGSRLATVESLVDHHTWAIDESIFVQPARAAGGLPYPADEAALLARGTQDKLLIGGRYYSDKSPVPALVMAGVYQSLQRSTGLVARVEPGRFF